MNKYLAIFTSSLKSSLEYRGALLTWILVELMTLTSAIFIWNAIFRTQSSIGSFQYPQMVLYYYLVPLVGAFTSIHLSEKIPRQIKDGQLSQELTKPYLCLVAIVAKEIATKSIQNTLKLPVYLIIGVIVFSSFSLSLSWTSILIGILACLFALVLHLLLDLTLSLFAFWFDDSWSLSLLKQVAFMVFGGLSFPLSLVPSPWQIIFKLLPFDLVYYFPASAFMGTLNSNQLFIYFSKWLLWSMILYLALRLLWLLGIKKYHAYGQ